MTRRKTTVYLDADVLTATKLLAVTRGRSESQVIEDALRTYFAGRADTARTELNELMDRLARREGLPTEDEAMATAVEEVRAVRAGRRGKTT